MRARSVCAGVMMAALLAAALEAEPREALVIGNGAYPQTLANPENDARLVAAALQRVGFRVEVHTDLDRKAMNREILQFGKRLRAAGPQATGLFYYGGHGLEVGGENFLLPLGAAVETEADIQVEGVRVQDVLAQMQAAGDAVNIVILDACRNAPILPARGGARGLARMTAPTGTYLAYSTAPGETAEDGAAGDHSPFAAALAAELAVPEPIDAVFTGVRRRVWSATAHRQTPWTASSLLDAFYFRRPQSRLAPPAATAQPPAARPQDGPPDSNGWLGIKIGMVTKQMADAVGLKEKHGAFVAVVLPDSPAAKAGLLPGDIVIAINDEPVSDQQDLYRRVTALSKGQTAKLRIWRRQEYVTVSAMVTSKAP